MPLPTHLSLRVAACLSVASLLVGCSSSDVRARNALSAYQAAAAANDIAAAKNALLQLVRAKDDVPDYWSELGKLQASTGNYNDAYYAFSRAYELDRSNVDVLRSVTELALRSGDLVSAQSHAEELSILSPGDPWPKLVKGWAAISRSHYEEAIAEADSLLANAPYDAPATMLKARGLIGLNRDDEAIATLTKQVQAQPSDATNRELLSRIYQRHGDWAKLLPITQQLSDLSPSNQQNMLLLIEAAFRSGNVTAGRSASLRLLRADADPHMISSVLDEWEDYWPSPQRISDARSLGGQAVGLDRKLPYAAFLNRVGSPQDAVRLIGSNASIPITGGNAEANAVVADAWARMGNLNVAKNRLDAVLAFDSGNASALRARAELELRTGNSGAAVIDAQKLVTVLPDSSRDRLLLARSYSAAGNNAWANRTLWRAFQDIPADEKIFAALEATKIGNADATRELQEEFDRQRDQKVSRGML